MNQVIEVNQEKVSVPYNPKNKLVTDEDIKRILSKYDIVIEVGNLDHYQKALTHISYTKKDIWTDDLIVKVRSDFPKETVELQEVCNERLEFLGDSVIKVIISNYLFNRYYYKDEGFMTKLKTNLEDKKSLSRLAKVIGLDEFILVSAQVEGTTGRTSEKILEDAFESFLGALFLDQGFLVCQKFITNILETEIDYSEILYKDTNYKDQLLRFYHQNKWKHPVYHEISHEGPPHNRIFTMGVTDSDGNVIGIGTDRSKKKAEQRSAKKALIHFGLLNDDQIKGRRK